MVEAEEDTMAAGYTLGVQKRLLTRQGVYFYVRKYCFPVTVFRFSSPLLNVPWWMIS